MNIDTNNRTGDEQPFDDALRARHAASLAQLSPRVRAQLAQRRNAALRGQAARPAHWVRYAAAGFAAVCALAIGLVQFRTPVPDAPPATVAGIATTAVSGTTMLDEDPEFYAWLASNDARLVAME